MLGSFPRPLNAAVIGASGGIGAAFCTHLEAHGAALHRFSRSEGSIDITDEASIAAAADSITEPLHLVIVASGFLSHETLQPEKALRDLSMAAMQEVFAVNAFGPALVAKHFIPKLARDEKAVFAALSAKVGSISDNALGGWYSYRASKAALNMLLKNTAIETARRHKHAAVIGLHPGTVATSLSGPFSGNVSHDIFTPEDATARMLSVIDGITPAQSGGLFSYDGKEIDP